MDIKYVTISDLNRYIKAKFDMDTHLNHVYLKGEISNFKHHTRGHFYFTLKDENSRIAAVMFASSAKSVAFEPEDGMKVLVSGRIALYEATGSYQIYVDSMELDGIGNLYLEFERLKKELAKEGLFDREHKKVIPKFPKKIGIITAPTGAAIRDILSTIKRRYPICETILFPALVQGTGAKESVVKQLNKAQEYDLDVIICGRGGGSIEDLWAFNEEIVARAIYNSKIPVISAVGHEIDFTIADYVADLRAPTPTGAAEMAVPNLVDLKSLIDQYKIRANEAVTNIIKKNRIKLESLQNSFVLKNPLSLYEIKEQKLDSYIDYLNQYMTNKLNHAKLMYEKVINNKILISPQSMFDKKKHQYELLLKTIEVLNPMKLLSSGYSIVKFNGKVIKNSHDVNLEDVVDIELSEGKLKCSVIGKEDKNG
ncbi:MAG TPA: exodeoxyribonuclease VII large subunit [Firmicutes bacterium]|nr:exodeoxyribonuclease VII large subunit [Bacillota bacterium]